MELEEGDTANERGTARGEGALASPALVPCSICLEAVKDGGERSTAKLLCGHQFHLDCIGSAFNAKGVMQCPNCRKVEKGDWLYANGCLSFREASVDDWTYDEDLYDLNFSEMSYGVHWCPFTRVARVPSSFEEGESPSMPYHSLDGHRAVFSVHPATSLPHSCPYLAYLYPLQASSSSSSQVSTESIVDDPTFHHDLSNQHGPISIQTSHPFPTIDIHYHRRETHLPPYSFPNSRINGGDQASVLSATMRATRHDSDGQLRPGTFLHPFVIRHGLASRSNTSSDLAVPHYLGNSHTQGRAQDLHGPYQQQGAIGMNAPSISGTRRSGGMRSLASRAPSASEHSALHLFPSTSSSGQSPQDAEATGANHFYAWERDQFTPFPLIPVERGSTWWGPLQQPPRPSDNGSQIGSWQQHGSDLSSSQGISEGFSHQALHPPHMYPFI